MWLICHKVVPSNELRFSRGLAMDPDCKRCHSAVETSLHCLYDCFSLWRIWYLFGFTADSGFFTDDPRQWLLGYAKDEKVILLFAVLGWLWVRRNKGILINSFGQTLRLCKEFSVLLMNAN